MAVRKLRILTANEVYKGTNAQGSEYTIFEVEAVDANTGVMITVPLRSFDYLVEGETADFTVEKYERPGKPVTYTLKKPKKGGASGANALGPKVDQLRERITLLEENLKLVQTNLADVMNRMPPLAPVTSLNGPLGAPVSVPPDDGSDIPFDNDGFPTYSERRNHDSRW